MFDFINEVAIVGTTFLMMAISTIWYSSMLFGKVATATKSASIKTDSRIQIVITFLSYFVMLSLLAYVLVLAPLLDLSVLIILSGVSTFVVSLLASFYAFENRSLRDFAISAGFYVLFVFGGGLVLTYWPW